MPNLERRALQLLPNHNSNKNRPLVWMAILLLLLLHPHKLSQRTDSNQQVVEDILILITTIADVVGSVVDLMVHVDGVDSVEVTVDTEREVAVLVVTVDSEEGIEVVREVAVEVLFFSLQYPK